MSEEGSLVIPDALTKPARPSGNDRVIERCSVFVSNLDYNVTEQRIRDVFSPVRLVILV